MLTERIQSLLDREVEGSPRARELLHELDGRRLQIVARFSPWKLTLHASEGKLRLLKESGGQSDTQLSGTPFALLALVREDASEVIRRGDVVLGGDAEVGARFQELLLLLRPDLEAGLARVIGDIPAHGTGLLLRKALDYGRGAVRTQATNVGEYLAHEKRVLVPRAEAAGFLSDVDGLRENVDRLAARVSALETRRNGA